MNKQWLDGMWDHMRQKYGIYLRVLEGIPADCYNDRPVPGMRTPTQLVVHTSGSIVRDIAEGVASGAIASEGASEDAIAEGLGSKDEVLEYARACWTRAEAAIAAVGDKEIAGPVGNSWGLELDGTFAVIILNEEFLHHRGQLFAYARACGAEPPFMWDFGNNAPDFQPRA